MLGTTRFEFVTVFDGVKKPTFVQDAALVKASIGAPRSILDSGVETMRNEG